MPEPLTKEEREKLSMWAQDIWDEGTGGPNLMGHALELLRYEETVCKLEERRAAFQDSQKLQA